MWDDSKGERVNLDTRTEELDSISRYKEKVSDTLDNLEEALSASEVVNSPVDVPSASSHAHSRIKLQAVPLPTYGGNINEPFEKFITSFEAVLASHPYSDYEKFLLLKKNVLGRASVLLDSLEFNKQSYVEAKSLLQRAFASPILQKFNTLQRLVDLKIAPKQDPLYLVSEMRQIVEMFKVLKIDTNNVLQFFYWQALPDTLKDHLIHLTNNSKPDLTEIENHIFAAIERLQSDSQTAKSTVNSKKIDNFAINVNYKNKIESVKTKQCSLCNGEHPYFKCSVYVSPAEKVRRLRDIKGYCVRCGQNNHVSTNCKLTELKCKICTGPHFPSLCTKNSPKPNITKNNSSTSNNSSRQNETLTVNSSMVIMSSYDKYDEGIALPTFTGEIGGKVVRILKDTGAQATLVSQALVDSLQNVVKKDSLPVTINGFNSSVSLNCEIVEIALDLGGDCVQLDALCVPEIKMNLQVPSIGDIVKKLKKYGYSLADKLLTENSNRIDSVGIVLGSNYAHCLPVSTQIFGVNNSSSFLQTQYGVMLEGDLRRMSEDLDSMQSNAHTETSVFQIICGHPKYVLCSEDGKVSESEVRRATEDMLESSCRFCLDEDVVNVEENEEMNNRLSTYCIDNCYRQDDGRLVLPLMWRSDVQHLLGTNFNLSKQILMSNLKKLSRDEVKLSLTDNAFAEQRNLGIIEQIPDFEEFKLNNPSYSFLPHMSVFRMNKSTTKCRLVYLSNMCENNPDLPKTLSHNQVLCSGPNLNLKLSSSVLLLRFDKYLMTFDLIKAFLMIGLREIDQARLLFMWFRDVSKGDYSIVYYKVKRLPMGIPCSPAILMLALYKLLIVDSEDSTSNEIDLRKLVYSLTYMDNSGFTINDQSYLLWTKNYITSLFEKYKFGLQQWTVNDSLLQTNLDKETTEETAETVKLLGLLWNRERDTLCTESIVLDEEADSKRKILKS